MPQPTPTQPAQRPTSVPCPSCQAPKGTACSADGRVHRRRRAAAINEAGARALLRALQRDLEG